MLVFSFCLTSNSQCGINKSFLILTNAQNVPIGERGRLDKKWNEISS